MGQQHLWGEVRGKNLDIAPRNESKVARSSVKDPCLAGIFFRVRLVSGIVLDSIRESSDGQDEKERAQIGHTIHGRIRREGKGRNDRRY